MTRNSGRDFFPPPRHRPVERLGKQDEIAVVRLPCVADAPGEMEALDEPLEARAQVGDGARFPVGMELQRERRRAMRSAQLGRAAEEDNLMPELLQRLANGEGKRLDAADLRRTGQVERGIGQEDADLHAVPFRTSDFSITSLASASTRSKGIVVIESP